MLLDNLAERLTRLKDMMIRGLREEYWKETRLLHDELEPFGLMLRYCEEAGKYCVHPKEGV